MIAVRYILGGVLAFGALNAFGGGIYGLLGARGVPTSWLAGSPFHDYVVPSLILMVVVGGSLLAAAVMVLSGKERGKQAAGVAALVLLVWLGAQVAIIGYVSLLQPTYAVVGLLILALARWLRPSGSPGHRSAAWPGTTTPPAAPETSRWSRMPPARR